MQKNIFTVIVSIVVLGVTIFFGVYVLRGEKQPPIPNTTSIPSVLQTSDPFTEIDYTSLEKDRLYAEEEGKYANLNETGKKLLRAILVPPECKNDPNGNYCYDYEEMINNSSIVALKNDLLLLDIPSGKGSSYYKVYDLKQRKIVGDQNFGYWGTRIRNNDMVIYVKNNNDETGRQRTTQNLFYYRPGMPEFSLVLQSQIPPTESYWYYGGMGQELSEVSFEKETLTISIFPYSDIEGKPVKLRQVTFNLSALP